MSTELTPRRSALIADLIYDVEIHSNSWYQRFERRGLTDLFDFQLQGLKKSKSGAFCLKRKSAFAFYASGKGAYKNHALLVFRGTTDFVCDSLTNLNAGVQLCESGEPVHAGFNRTYSYMRDRIKLELSLHRPRHLHIVGHSLGGGLAQVAADSILRSEYSPPTTVYTFGSPRVGFKSFADKLSQNNKLTVYRAYLSGDPVAMVPLWPYVHAPQPSGECFIQYAGGSIFSHLGSMHMMRYYTDAVSNHKTWKTLIRPHPTLNAQWKNVEESLLIGSPIAKLQQCAKLLQMFLTRSIGACNILVSGTVVGGAHILDALSHACERSCRESEESKTFVHWIVKTIFNILGQTYKATKEITRFIIRDALTALYRTLMQTARSALLIGNQRP